MRTRWIAGIFAASALALVTAASLAQRAERPRMAISSAPIDAPPDRKPWRSKAQPEAPTPPPSPLESAPLEPARAAEDPMDAVESFLRRNRKEADDSIQALTREAEALRARLAKVEAALARWQAVAGSLNPGQKWAQPDGPSEPGPEPGPVESAPRLSSGAKALADPPPPSTPDPIPAPGPATPPPGGDTSPSLPGVPPPIADNPPPPK